MYDERRKAITDRVNSIYTEWKADPETFSDRYPDIRISITRGNDPRACAMRSIADYVMANNSRYGWEVAECFGSDPRPFITSLG